MSQEVLHEVALQLALDYARSECSTSSASALRILLPGLKYCSLSADHPGSGGLVSTANLAVAGPLVLSLHDSLTSAAGMVMSRGKGVQASLQGRGGAMLTRLSDVQQMLATFPGCTYTMCMSVDGSGSLGALLLGFAEQPALNEGELSVLVALCENLSIALSCTAPSVLSMIDHVLGTAASCVCCDDEPAIPDDPQDPCRDPKHRDDDGAEPSQGIAVPVATICEDGTAQALQSVQKSGALPPADDSQLPAAAAPPPPVGAEPGSSSSKGAGAKAPAATELPSAAAAAPPSAAVHRFEKQLLMDVQPAELASQNPLLLTYRSSRLEKAFCKWYQMQMSPVDALFSALVAVVLSLMVVAGPNHLVTDSPARLILAAMACIPAIMMTTSLPTYLRLREVVLVFLRLYLAVVVTWVGLPSSGQALTDSGHLPALSFCVMSSGEALLTLALGFQVRLALHIPLQITTLALAIWQMPHTCSSCYAGVPAGDCFSHSAMMTVMVGCVLPTLVVRVAERRGRWMFAQQLQTAAGVVTA